MGVRTVLGISFVALFLNGANAQTATYLQTIIIGAEGTASVKAVDAESNLEDLQKQLVKLIGLRPKMQVTVSAKRPASGGAYQRIAGVVTSSDSSDLVICVVQGAWAPNTKAPELSVLAGLPEPLSAEYLVNVLHFLPVSNAVMFVLAPDAYEFPRSVVSESPTGVSGGGKYLITVRLREKDDFETLVEKFEDIIDDDWEYRAYDMDGDARISFSEWLGGFTRRAGIARLVGSIYRISDGSDLQIRKLQ